MGIVAKFETFFKEFEQEEVTRQQVEYQVVDAARWLLENDHVRKLPGMSEDHLGLLAGFVMYSVAHKNRMPLRVKQNRSEGLWLDEETKLVDAGFRTTVVYTHALAHPRAILFKEIDTDPQLSVTMMFASGTRQMEEVVRSMQGVLGDPSERISYDINTNAIRAVSEHPKILSFIPDPYVPLVPSGHKPLAVWVGTQIQ